MRGDDLSVDHVGPIGPGRRRSVNIGWMKLELDTLASVFRAVKDELVTVGGHTRPVVVGPKRGVQSSPPHVPRRRRAVHQGEDALAELSGDDERVAMRPDTFEGARLIVAEGNVGTGVQLCDE